MALYMYFYSFSPRNFISPAIMGALGWTCLVMIRLGQLRYVAHAAVAGMLVAALASIIAFGSLRAPGILLFVAAVVAAGTFLGRLALVLSVAFTACSLTILLWFEQKGLLLAYPMKADLRTLMTYLTITVGVAAMVYYARERTQRAHQQLLAELEARRIAEQERDRSNERFARIFRNSPSPMLAQSARNGLILDVNPAFERCYGFQRDQALGRDDAFLWADPGQRDAYVKVLIEHRSAHHFECLGLRSDGSTFNALISSEMGNDPHDKLVITTVADVSAQTETLERLQRSEERFAKAFNFSPLNMTITRLKDGSFVEVNRTDDSVQGLTPADLEGRTSVEVGAWLRPQDRDRFVERLQREGRLNGYETRMRHKDGSMVDARLWAVIIDIDGEECILSCSVNISEEKRREAQLLALTRGMAGPSGDALFQALTMHMAHAIGADMVAVGELRQDGRVRTLAVWKDGTSSRNYTYALGGTPCGSAMEQRALCVVENGLDGAFSDYKALVDEGLKAYVGQSLRDDDGTPVGVLTAFWRHPIELPEEARALIAIFASRANAELVRLRRDREIQRLNTSLEQRVRERTAELQKLNAELDSFAYSVSHDLKSPLRAIDGFTRLLGEQLEGRLQADEQQLFERVLASTRRMSTLIADLLALARVSQGTIELAPTDLSAMAEQVMQSERARQPERPLRWHIEPGLVSRCDARLARIALENLLGNAVKYTRDQAAPLIRVGRVPDSAGAFFVRDNGVGFNMAYADKLFKPFQRLHMPSEFEGTGIGLATVRRIVERHGGAISGMSTPGHGAEFRFSMEPTGAAITHNEWHK